MPMQNVQHRPPMALLSIIGFMLLPLYDVTAEPAPSPSPAPLPGDPRLCVGDGDDVMRFEVLPGSGWDNLRNVEGGSVLKMNYSQCRRSEDGRYLLPDLVTVFPEKTSRVDSAAEVIYKSGDYKSAWSRDINTQAGLQGIVDISGSFSDEYRRMQSSLIDDDTFTTRTQARYVRYRAVAQPDTPLDEGFKYRLMAIAGAIELGDARLARFQSQQLVREFGTHVVTSVEAGASLLEENQVSNDLRRRTDFSDKMVKLAAGASFLDKFGKFSFGASTSSVDTAAFKAVYEQNVTDSLVDARGGGVVNATNASLATWSLAMEGDLVAVGRGGEPLHQYVTAVSLPDLPTSTRMQLADHVRSAVMTYYKVNTHPGCTDRTAVNFSPRANVEDGSCRAPQHNTTLGGVYTQCNHSAVDAGDLCTDVTQVNPATGDFSCPTGYEAVALHTGTMTHSEVEHVCSSCWLVFGHCCHDNVLTSEAQYTSYWCSPTGAGEAVSGYLFGGVYSPSLVNHVTSGPSCPHGYVALRMGGGLRVCVSDDFDDGEEVSVPFAGFFSCSAGNPLTLTAVSSVGVAGHVYMGGAGAWPRACPRGYSQYVSGMMDGCEINHCVQTARLPPRLPALRRPPFEAEHLATPAPQNVFIFDQEQKLWVKNQDAIQLNKSHSEPLSRSRPLPSSRVTLTYDQLTFMAAAVLGLLMLVLTLNCAMLVLVLKGRVSTGNRQGYKGQSSWGHDNHVAMEGIRPEGKRSM